MRYEVVVNLKCKSVIDASSEEEAIKEAMKVRVDRQILSGVKESVVKLGETPSKEIISKVIAPIKEVTKGMVPCPACFNMVKQEDMKKDRWNNPCCSRCA